MRHGLVWVGMLVLVGAMGTTASMQSASDARVIAAARAGDNAAVRRLIAARADVNAAERDGSTALLWAVYNADLEMTRALVAAGAKVDTANRYGVTPLLQAARTGETAIVEALLTAGANPTLAHPEGETPLMAAARSGKVEAVRLLLARGADVNETDEYQEQSALMWAASEGHLNVVQALLEAGANPNLKAKETALTQRRHGDHPTGGFTPLMWAVRNGNEDVVEALVKGGADINAKNGDGATATIIAIVNDRLDLAAKLLDMGADPNDGALYFAVDWHDGTTDMRLRDGGLLRWDFPNTLTSIDLINKLLAMGADPNKPFRGALHSYSLGTGDNHNSSPFYRAAVASDVEVLKILASKGDMTWSPPAGARGGAPRPPLVAASVGGRGYPLGGGPGFTRNWKPEWREPGSREPIDAVKVLLDAGADPNVQNDDDGNTVLHMAAERNDLEMIKVLAAGGADFEVYNWTGQLPLDIAEEAVAKKKAGEEVSREELAAMAATGEVPVSKAEPEDTVALIRELMGGK
ncbi:MAG: ankyrin repeat domain-containing protein [Vicinamibacterales bacterium]